MNNIILTGMPGTGKSTVGVLLAKALKMPFIDTDLLLQEKENMFLQEIILDKGIEAFLKAEEEIVLELRTKGSVIATGGSVVLKEKAMKCLKTCGLVLYLKLSFSEIENRIKNIKTRGIAMQEEQTLYSVFVERTPLYEKYADETIPCMGKSMEEIVEEIKTLWTKNLLFMGKYGHDRDQII